ncbi:MAG: hypothetical protein ACRECO_09040 [Xanthobacteraceae bacterium]
MCWACEEEALWRRYLMQVAATQDAIPEGLEPADFEMAGVPLPGTAAARMLGAESAADQFACDSPDRQ